MDTVAWDEPMHLQGVGMSQQGRIDLRCIHWRGLGMWRGIECLGWDWCCGVGWINDVGIGIDIVASTGYGKWK